MVRTETLSGLIGVVLMTMVWLAYPGSCTLLVSQFVGMLLWRKLSFTILTIMWLQSYFDVVLFH
jgi:hypothetical protein